MVGMVRLTSDSDQLAYTQSGTGDKEGALQIHPLTV